MPQDPARPRATAIITIPAHPDLRTIMARPDTEAMAIPRPSRVLAIRRVMIKITDMQGIATITVRASIPIMATIMDTAGTPTTVMDTASTSITIMVIPDTEAIIPIMST